MKHVRGFTLFELVLVIAITGILAGFGARVISIPVQSFVEGARRAELTDAAAVALVRMSRDIRAALPNSVRVSGSSALELLSVVDGERYRTDPPANAADRLSFTTSDNSFNTLGRLGTAASYASHRLAVFPLGQSGASPYADAVMTAAMTIGVAATAAPSGSQTSGEWRITMSASHLFPFESPAHRIFLVSGPVSYICANGGLFRYSGYTLASTQPATGAATGVTGMRVVDKVESCTFTYQTTQARRGLVSLSLVLVSGTGTEAERIRLTRQVHVDNTP